MTLAMTEPALTPLDIRRRRLLYRATHRGTYENDLLIGGYVQPPYRHHDREPRWTRSKRSWNCPTPTSPTG